MIRDKYLNILGCSDSRDGLGGIFAHKHGAATLPTELIFYWRSFSLFVFYAKRWNRFLEPPPGREAVALNGSFRLFRTLWYANKA